MQFANLAYSKEVPPLEQFREVHVLDLLCTPITSLIIDNFPNLKRLRASRSSLKKAEITNCPNLEVIDMSQNTKLVSINLENLPNLRCLDLRNTGIYELGFSFPSLEYLDISYTYINDIIPEAPNLLAFDNSGCEFKYFDLLPIANKYPRLQRLRSLDYADRIFENEYGINHPINLNLNELSKHPCLEHIFCGPCRVTCDSISSQTHLSVICLQYPEFWQGSADQLLSKFHTLIIGSSSESYNTYKVSKFPDYHPMSWEDSALLVFGPWGIPTVDLNPVISPPVAFHQTPLLSNLPLADSTFSEISTKYDLKIAINHMMGSVFGSALGDSLGMSIEFTNTNYARFSCDVPLSYLWNTLPSWGHSDTFYRGTVTDDTEQAVMIMRTLGDCNGELNLSHFASLMKKWAIKGIPEHCQPYAFDVGATVGSAVHSDNYIEDPLSGSFENTQKSRGNGCAMRTAPVGCFKFWDLNEVIKNSVNFGCATHFNDVCMVCTILLSLLIAKNIQKQSSRDCNVDKKMSEDEIDKTIEVAFDVVEKNFSDKFDVAANKQEIMKFLNAKSFEELDLSGRRIGYVLRATGAAVLALRKGLDFVEALSTVLRWAGDADSNAAIVGGVIGAVVGFDKIPSNLMKYLFTGNWEYVEFARMCKAMNIDAPPSPFLNLSYL